MHISTVHLFSILKVIFICSGNIINRQSYTSSKQNDISDWDNPLCDDITIEDPLWDHQWYLDKSNRTSYDLNVIPAWKRCYNGSGVVVAVVDGGMYDNEDLNINRTASYDPFPEEHHDLKHGTRVAGIIGAKKNDMSGVGIAFDATIVDIRMLINHPNFKTEGKALTASLDYVDVYSNSFNHFASGFKVHPLAPEVERAIETGVSKGRDGKGAIYVWSTGNGGRTFFADYCAYEGFCNSISVISVAGIQHDLSRLPTAEECSAMMIAAFSRDPYDTEYEIITTDGLNDTTDTFGRNSAAVPMVSGAIALALQANPDLGYRDVMHLLVQTARGDLPFKINDFQTNGAGLNVSSTFGFGLLDISALVKRSISWKNVPPFTKCHSRLESNNNYSLNPCLELELESTCGISNLEHVVAHVRISSRRAGHIRVYLTSPCGTRSLILPGRYLDDRTLLDINVTSVQFWGENPVGTWYMTIEDHLDLEGEVEEWSLSFTGVQGKDDLYSDHCEGNVTRNTSACQPVEVIHLTTEGYTNTTVNGNGNTPTSSSTTVIIIVAISCVAVLSVVVTWLSYRFFKKGGKKCTL